MDHGDHSGHSGHTMPGMEQPMPSCAMNMLWNNQVADTCVVFRSWHISGTGTMFLSCIIIIAISLFYSYLLHYIKQYDRQVAFNVYSSQQSGSAARRDSNAGLSTGTGAGTGMGLIPPIPVGYGGAETGSVGKIGVTKLPLKIKITRAGLYAISVAISFWLMLVAMTYNTYLFSSIVIGAFLGHIVYEGELDVGAVLGGTGTKGLACH